MNIRTATFDDIEAIVDIYNQAITAGQKTADVTPVTAEDREYWFEDHTTDRYPILIAEDSNLIVGYLTISAYRPGRMALRYTAEVSYYVHFEHHRQGIARVTSHIPRKGAKQVIYYGAKPGSIADIRCEALQVVVDTRLANTDSGGVLEQYVEDR